MATWPTELPLPLADGYQLDPVDPVMRTAMEVGYSRARRITRARNDRVSVRWLFTAAQFAAFRTWYDGEANGGASWFIGMLTLGENGVQSYDCKFVQMWQAALVSRAHWTVSATLEIRGAATPTQPDFEFAQFVHFDHLEANATLLSAGVPASFPTLTVNGDTTALRSQGDGILRIVEGNRTTRVFGNSTIDELMRQDNLSVNYPVWFFATKIKRFPAEVNLTKGERIFQYGDQGSSTAAPDGGVVARFNGNDPGTAPFLDNTISFAIHVPWPGDVIGKPGSQVDANYADPIATTRQFSDAELAAGLSVMFIVDNSVSPYRAVILVDGVLDAQDVQTQSLTNYPLPGKSVNGPGNDTTSNGFVLFNQSVNQLTATSGPLKSAHVYPIWIGRTTSYAQAVAMAQALHADPFADPYLA